MLPPAPSPPCVSPGLTLALADREFINDGSPVWSPQWAQRMLHAKGVEGEVRGTLDVLQAASQPAPVRWLGDRLTILWTMFMASRVQVDAEALTIWLAEYTRLLADLPHDIVAHSIDRAIQSTRHGFLPSVGEVRSIAEPLAEERDRIIERLSRLVQFEESER